MTIPGTQMPNFNYCLETKHAVGSIEVFSNCCVCTLGNCLGIHSPESILSLGATTPLKS